jgi:hypothetical protein
MIEIIAKAIYKDYKNRHELEEKEVEEEEQKEEKEKEEEKKEEGEKTEDKQPLPEWDELPETLKESNRQQADHIGVKLKELGLGIAPLTDWDEKLFEYSEKEEKKIESIAKMEHDRWIKERKRSGWKPGPEKDIEKKRTPFLIAWDELDDNIKEEDIAPVLNLPKYLAEAGYKVYRKKK